MASFCSFVLPSLFHKVKAAAGGVKARGWGESIHWVSLDEGHRLAANQQKPMMLVVHRMNCPACIQMKRHFSSNSRIQDLSQNFVMVNLFETETPAHQDYQPDGLYVPRVLFYTPRGQLMSDVRHDDGEYMYNYPDVGSLGQTMQNVINYVLK